MRGIRTVVTFALIVSLLGSALFQPPAALAHCDGLDGPVVMAARQALETGNMNGALIWVQDGHETEIREAFQKTLAVRALSPEAREFADMYFFETLVRLHRAGEGAPYTGLKPAGRDLGPAIPAADRALESAQVEPLVELTTSAVEHGIKEQFEHAMSLKNFRSDDVAAGRKYIEAYVEFVHYVERLYDAATHTAAGHFDEASRPATALMAKVEQGTADCRGF